MSSVPSAASLPSLWTPVHAECILSCLRLDVGVILLAGNLGSEYISGHTEPQQAPAAHSAQRRAEFIHRCHLRHKYAHHLTFMAHHCLYHGYKFTCWRALQQLVVIKNRLLWVLKQGWKFVRVKWCSSQKNKTSQCIFSSLISLMLLFKQLEDSIFEVDHGKSCILAVVGQG